MRTDKKHQLAKLRHWRVRKKVRGTSDRPRMSVRFTNEHIYVQFIDDSAGRTLASASTRAKATPDRESLAANVAGAKAVGKLAAETALAQGIKAVVFDRGGARYHWSKGKVMKRKEEKGKEEKGKEEKGKEEKGKEEKGKEEKGKEEKAKEAKGTEAQPVLGKLAALADAARQAGLQF